MNQAPQTARTNHGDVPCTEQMRTVTLSIFTLKLLLDVWIDAKENDTKSGRTLQIEIQVVCIFLPGHHP